MKFVREKTKGLDGTVYAHREQSQISDPEGFTILASSRGVKIGNSPWIEDRDALDDLAQAIGSAWNDFLRLKPKLTL